VEHRLHFGLQVQPDDRLGDPVRDGGNAEHPHASIPLGYLHRAHRRREVAPRRQPVPELEQVPFQVPLELLDRLLVNAGRALVGLDPPIGLPNRPFGDIKRLRLRLAHPAPPARKRLTAKPARTTHPLRSSPITGPSPLLRDDPPLCPASLLGPRSCCCSGSRFRDTTAGQHRATGRPRARDDRFPRSAPKPKPSSRHLHAGHRLASQQAPCQAHPGTPCQPRFRCHLCSFDTSSVVRFRSPSRLTPAALKARLFPRRSPPRLLTAAARGGLQPPPAGRLRRATRPPARHLHLRYSTASVGPTFYIEPPQRSWHTQDRAPALQLHLQELARPCAGFL
jgi:hypothetical protein